MCIFEDVNTVAVRDDVHKSHQVPGTVGEAPWATQAEQSSPTEQNLVYKAEAWRAQSSENIETNKL